MQTSAGPKLPPCPLSIATQPSAKDGRLDGINTVTRPGALQQLVISSLRT
jgi:hypothetical protein